MYKESVLKCNVVGKCYARRELEVRYDYKFSCTQLDGVALMLHNLVTVV